MRSLAREVVYKYLFSRLYNDDSGEKFLNALISENKLSSLDAEFALKLSKTIIDNLDEFKSDIERLATDYTYKRVFSMDKCAIFIGMAEIKYFDEIPNAVSIDEAVNLSVKYGTDRSLGFVNGILAKYNKELTENKE